MDLRSGQKPCWNRYLTPVINFGEVQRAQLAKSTLLSSALVPLGSSQIPSKTAAWVPEFAVEDLPLSRTATLVPEFGQNTHDDDDDDMGQRVIGFSGSLIWSKTLMELIFNPCGEFW